MQELGLPEREFLEQAGQGWASHPSAIPPLMDGALDPFPAPFPSRILWPRLRTPGRDGAAGGNEAGAGR